MAAATPSPAAVDILAVTDSANSGVDRDIGSAAESSGEYTGNFYRDKNIRINVATVRFYNTDVDIADIKLRSLNYLKAAFAQDTFGRNITQTTSAMAEAHNAIFAVNGDYCGFRNSGFVIRNGVLYRSTPRSWNDDETLVVYGNGNFVLINENNVSASALMEQGAVQAFSFGPSLLINGKFKVNETRDVGGASPSNPRTAVGIISSLHYIAIVSDGRTDASAGLTLYQLAGIFRERGCKTAYNLDGGGSSTMWFKGQIVNVPTDGMKPGERKISDIVYVGY